MSQEQMVTVANMKVDISTLKDESFSEKKWKALIKRALEHNAEIIKYNYRGGSDGYVDLELSDKEDIKVVSFARNEERILKDLERLIKKIKHVKSLGDISDIRRHAERLYDSLSGNPEKNPEQKSGFDDNDYEIDETKEFNQDSFDRGLDIEFAEKALKRIIDELRAKSYIHFGEFRASKIPGKIGKIIIYWKAIEKYGGGNNYTPEADLMATVAHELFHAFHYSCFLEKGFAEDWFMTGVSKDRPIVQESLASAYAWEYCKEHGMKGLNRAYEENWKEIDIRYSPYSGALGITKQWDDFNNDVFYKTMANLLNGSLVDWVTAAIDCRIGYDKAL